MWNIKKDSGSGHKDRIENAKWRYNQLSVWGNGHCFNPSVSKSTTIRFRLKAKNEIPELDFKSNSHHHKINFNNSPETIDYWLSQQSLFSSLPSYRTAQLLQGPLSLVNHSRQGELMRKELLANLMCLTPMIRITLKHI